MGAQVTIENPQHSRAARIGEEGLAAMVRMTNVVLGIGLVLVCHGIDCPACFLDSFLCQPLGLNDTACLANSTDNSTVDTHAGAEDGDGKKGKGKEPAAATEPAEGKDKGGKKRQTQVVRFHGFHERTYNPLFVDARCNFRSFWRWGGDLRNDSIYRILAPSSRIGWGPERKLWRCGAQFSRRMKWMCWRQLENRSRLASSKESDACPVQRLGVELE